MLWRGRRRLTNVLITWNIVRFFLRTSCSLGVPLCAARASCWDAENVIRFEPGNSDALDGQQRINAPPVPCVMRELGNKWTAWHAGHERVTVHLIRTRKEIIKMFWEGVTIALLKVSMYIAANNYTCRCLCCQRFSSEFVCLQSTRHMESQGVQLHVENAFWEANIPQRGDRFLAFYGTRKFITVLKEVATDPYSQPGASNPVTPTLFL